MIIMSRSWITVALFQQNFLELPIKLYHPHFPQGFQNAVTLNKRTQGLPASTNRTAFKSYHKLVKCQLSNLYQTSASKPWPIFSQKISTQIQHFNLDRASASILWAKTRHKNSTKPQLQNLDQTVVNTFFSINFSNTNNIKKFWVGIFKGQSHISQVRYTGVSQLVS